MIDVGSEMRLITERGRREILDDRCDEFLHFWCEWILECSGKIFFSVEVGSFECIR